MPQEGEMSPLFLQLVVALSLCHDFGHALK